MTTWTETKQQRLEAMTPDERSEHVRRYAAVRLALVVGDAVRDRRETLHLTQRELAAMMGTSQPKVSRLEAGEDNVTLATLQRAASALDIDPATLLTEPNRPAAPETDVDQATTRPLQRGKRPAPPRSAAG